MKRIGKIILGIILSLVIILGLLYGSFVYLIKYHVATVSSETYGPYEVVMQSVGSPLFFSSADGRLVLKKKGKTISKTDFVLDDDGGNIHKETWSVSWFHDYVAVVISGSEQSDALYHLYYNGKSTFSYMASRDDSMTTQEDMGGNDASEIRKELRLVADFLNYKDIKYEISAKGWLYAVVYQQDDVTKRIDYYETHEHEYVYQECDSHGNTKILGFYKVDNGKVIDEKTTSWH